MTSNCTQSLCLTVHCLVRALVRSKTCFQAALGHLISMLGSYSFISAPPIALAPIWHGTARHSHSTWPRRHHHSPCLLRCRFSPY
jgi:hypothetical protein